MEPLTETLTWEGLERSVKRAAAEGRWQLVKGRVVASAPKAGGEYRHVEIEAPYVAEHAGPGQFVMLRGTEWGMLLLSRPFDLYRANPERGTIEVLLKVKGEGTQRLAGLQPSDPVWVTGPLGRRLPLPSDSRGIGLVSRGAGVSPMVHMAHACADRNVPMHAVVSARSADRLLGVRDLEAAGARVTVLTDDQSDSEELTAILRSWVESGQVDRLYTCGSRRMAKAVQAVCREYGIAGYAFTDVYMACGIGPCNGCAVTVRDGATGETAYALACVEGPAMPVERLVLD